MSDADKTPEQTKRPDSISPAGARRAAPAVKVFVALVMLALAALLGGIVATYWPLAFGTPAESRLSAIETTVNRMAATIEAQDDAFQELRDAIAQAKTRLDAAETRIGALEAAAGGKANQPGGIVPRISALESKSAQSADAIAALTSRVNGVEAAVPADLPQRLDNFASKAVTADLDMRLAKLEAANTAGTLRQAATMLALADLTRAAQDARPFAPELDALASTAPDDPAVKILLAYAGQGVPTPEILAERFPPAARAALDAERRGPTPNLLTRMWNSILELVAVRRVGNLAGATTEARLARAQVALDAHDLAAAAADVGPIMGPAAASLAPWLADARARLAVDRAIVEMKTRVARALAAPAATGAPAAAPSRPIQGPAP